jgi:hypothetical protein
MPRSLRRGVRMCSTPGLHLAATLQRRSTQSVAAAHLTPPDVFVEVELDWREAAVSVLVGKLVEGPRPDGCQPDPTGRRVRSATQVLAPR